MIISWVMTRETILSQTWSGPMLCHCFLKSKLQIIKLLYRLRISFWYASLVVVDVFAIFFYSIVHCPFSFMYVYCLRFWWLLTRPSKCTVDKKTKIQNTTLCILNWTNPSRFTNTVKNVLCFLWLQSCSLSNSYHNHKFWPQTFSKKCVYGSAVSRNM